MKQLKSSEAIVGKTIIKALELNSSSLAFIFEDSYILYNVNRGYERGDEEIQVCENNPNDYVLLQMEFINKEEYDKRRQDETKIFQEQQEASELATFNRLRKKYGQWNVLKIVPS